MTETREERGRRRRWLNLAELVAVAGVVIAGAGLWINYQDRRGAAEEKAAAVTAQARAGQRVTVTGTVADDGRTLKLAAAERDLTEVAITYPTALGVGVQRPGGEPALSVEPFRAVLLKLTDGGADDKRGRLPVLLTASYPDGERTASATGLYDVTWATQGRTFAGRSLKLTGLRLRRHGGDLAALDAAWAREKP